uniref:Ig-like domain-containing protein n=1 Tax=Timema cristinae TaxID=61476 RepID=A0A7R9GSE8_TIMCR|nr:unnamed protein product [Timema cristinae]
MVEEISWLIHDLRIYINITINNYFSKHMKYFLAGVEGLYDSQGPNFVSEPSSKVEFTNTSGGRIDCSAKGNPMPNVEWLGGDKLAVSTIPGIRLVRSNGSIIFPPFDAEAFRQDVHWAVYRCVASNSVGSIVSRDITVRAVTDAESQI